MSSSGNSEQNVNNPPNMENKSLLEKVTKSVVFLILVMALTKLVMIKYLNNEESETYEFKERNDSDIGDLRSDIEVLVNDVNQQRGVEENPNNQRFVPSEPTCPKSYLLVILEEICTELIIKKELCSPGDFYDQRKRNVGGNILQNQPQKETKVPAIINYAVGALLITSVGAALLELYKAKKQNPSKNGKHPLSRKCSLADLTVLKHHRKELIRRESILEVPEERDHMKQLGFVPPPLQRRCSFPVGQSTTESSRYGMTVDHKKITLEPIRRISVIDEKACFTEDRKQSIVGDSRRTSIDRSTSTIDGRRISVDDSPERRHHRLVHRH